MTKRYVFGSPIETDAILCKPEAEQWENGRLSYQENALTCEMEEEEIVYGLGGAGHQ